MSNCEGCGSENPQGRHFCSQCGRILPSSSTPPRNATPEDLAAFASGDLFSGMFDKSRPLGETQPGAQETPSTTPSRGPAASATPPATAQTRAEMLAKVAKVATRALAKSVALSLAVLGPGFVMLMMGITVLGMIWLFVGSFGLMAWTYRKPWRLGAISCLLPPAAAGICYLVQLSLFGSDAPPAMLVLAAVGIGIGVGYWRAQTHEVKAGEDGGIVAERTIEYLLVWVAAYGATQVLGILARGTFAVPAGLITGAFTTAMLAVVSIVIWRRYRALGQVAAIMLLALTGLYAPVDRAEAQGSSCTSLFSQSDRSYRRLKRNCESNFRKGIRDRELLKILAHKDSGQFAEYRKEQEAERLVSSGGNANLLKAFDVYAQVYRAQVSDNLILRKSILSKMINLASPNSAPEMLQRIRSITQEYNNLNAQICSAQSRGYSGLPSFARQKSAADSCLAYIRSVLAQAKPPVQQPANPRPSAPNSSTGPDTQLCWSTLSNGRIGPQPGLSDADPKCLFKLTCREAMKFDAKGGKVEFQDRRYTGKSVGYIEPGECSNIVAAGTAVPDGGGGQEIDPDWEYEPPRPPGSQDALIEDSARVAAAVASVLIAAGIAVNVAQAIAAAIANALQAGVQLTAEEIQSAIADALLNRSPDSDPDGSGVGAGPDIDNDPGGGDANAPPNVAFSDRFRPPTPVYQSDGTALETNGDGKYKVRGDDGKWGWKSRAAAQAILDKQDAEEKSATPDAPATPKEEGGQQQAGPDKARPPRTDSSGRQTAGGATDEGEEQSGGEPKSEATGSRRTERPSAAPRPDDATPTGAEPASPGNSSAAVAATGDETESANAGPKPGEAEHQQPSYFGRIAQRLGDGIAGFGNGASQLMQDVSGWTAQNAGLAAGDFIGHVGKDSNELGQAAQDFWQAPSRVGEAIGRAVAEDPFGAMRTAAETIGTTARDVATAPTRLGEAIGREAGRILTDPDNQAAAMSAATEIIDDPGRAARIAAETVGTTIYDAATIPSWAGRAAGEAVGDFVSDPDNIVDIARVASGLENFENAMDPERSPLSRVGQVGAAVVNLGGTLSGLQATGQAMRSGVTALAGGAGSMVDDGVRAAASSLDEMATAAGTRAAGMVDEAAAAGAGAAGFVDEAAAAGSGAAGFVDEAAAASTGATGMVDEAAAASTGAAGMVDDAAAGTSAAADDLTAGSQIAGTGDEAAAATHMDDGVGPANMDDGLGGGGDGPDMPPVDDPPPPHHPLDDGLPPAGPADEIVEEAAEEAATAPAVATAVIPARWRTDIATGMTQTGDMDCAKIIGRTLKQELTGQAVGAEAMETAFAPNMGPGGGIRNSRYENFMQALGFETGPLPVNGSSGVAEQAAQLRRIQANRPNSRMLVDIALPGVKGRHAAVIDGIESINGVEHILIREPVLGTKLRVPLREIINGPARSPAGDLIETPLRRLSINWRNSFLVS